MLHARGQSTAVLQQRHVDRLHRHTIHATSAGMAHANGPTARATVTSTSWWWGQEQRVVLNFGDVDTTQKATGATSAQIDFICVICTNNSSTAAVASLSFPLSLSLSLFKGTSHFSTCPFIFSQLQRSVTNSTNDIYSLLPQHRYRLRMNVYYVPVVLLLLLPLFLSLYLSLSLFKGTSHNNIAIAPPTLLRSYNEVFVQTAFIPYFPSGTYYFSICDHGPDSLHAIICSICDKWTFSPLTGGYSKGLGAFRFFFK